MGDHLFEVGGVHVSRLEDVRLITGAGTYASDWNLPGQLHAAFVRSDRAHAKIVSIDTGAARKHPGVAGVYTGEDAVSAGYVKPAVFLNFHRQGRHAGPHSANGRRWRTDGCASSANRWCWSSRIARSRRRTPPSSFKSSTKICPS